MSSVCFQHLLVFSLQPFKLVVSHAQLGGSLLAGELALFPSLKDGEKRVGDRIGIASKMDAAQPRGGDAIRSKHSKKRSTPAILVA